MTRPIRLAALVSHPIQYQAPLFRQVAARAGLDLEVLFMSDHGVKTSIDPGFGKAIAFDVPLLDGYRHRFLPNRAPRPAVGTFAGQVNPAVVPVLLRERYDALWVHGYTQATTWAAFAAAKSVGTKLLLRGESTLTYETGGPRLLAKRALIGGLVRASDALLFIGEDNRRFYEAYGAKPRQLFFSPYSVDNAYFAQRGEQARETGARERLRQSVGASEGDLLLLFVGKLVPRKRPLDVVAALRLLPPNVVAAFVGDGEQRAELEQAIKSSGVRATVVGFANQSELPGWYVAADLQVLPSARETWGLVVNEGMACGLPAAVSDRVGCGKDLLAGGAGVVFGCGDAGALASSIRPLAIDRAALDGMRVKALARVADYDVSKTADGVEAAVRAVCGRASDVAPVPGAAA